MKILAYYINNFDNRNEASNLAYRPQFIANNHREGRKVLGQLGKLALKVHVLYFTLLY